MGQVVREIFTTGVAAFVQKVELSSTFRNYYATKNNTRTSSCSVIVRVSVVLKRTVGDSD